MISCLLRASAMNLRVIESFSFFFHNLLTDKMELTARSPLGLFWDYSNEKYRKGLLANYADMLLFIWTRKHYSINVARRKLGEAMAAFWLQFFENWWWVATSVSERSSSMFAARGCGCWKNSTPNTSHVWGGIGVLWHVLWMLPAQMPYRTYLKLV